MINKEPGGEVQLETRVGTVHVFNVTRQEGFASVAIGEAAVYVPTPGTYPLAELKKAIERFETPDLPEGWTVLKDVAVKRSVKVTGNGKVDGRFDIVQELQDEIPQVLEYLEHTYCPVARPCG